MKTGFHIRAVRKGDRAACGQVYFDAVRNGTAPVYTAAQAEAWAPEEDHVEWGNRLYSGTTWVAEGAGDIQGFITFRADGHLDLFFVRPGWRKAGVAGALYDRALEWARDRGFARLTTDASLLAQSFLARRGWQVLAEEQAGRRGQLLTRFKMVLSPV